MDDLKLPDRSSPFEKREPSAEERIDALAQQPLVSTGKPPSLESVAEAKRIAGLKDLSDQELAALGKTVGVHVAFPQAPDADPDEEPPEPEGHVLVKEVADWIARGGQEYFHGSLPPDLAAIWGHPPHRVADEATARILVAAWGLDAFRTSALHRAALQEKARSVNSSDPARRKLGQTVRVRRDRLGGAS
jgi:hypothetical protein